MEIKSVKKCEVEYPTMNQMSDSKIKNAIPKKWIKLGVTSIVFNMLMKSKVLGISFDESQIAGGFPTPIAIPLHVKVMSTSAAIFEIISTIALVISGSSMIITKRKSKKKGESKKVSRKTKLVFILSVIVLILSFVIGRIATYL